MFLILQQAFQNTDYDSVKPSYPILWHYMDERESWAHQFIQSQITSKLLTKKRNQAHSTTESRKDVKSILILHDLYAYIQTKSSMIKYLNVLISWVWK